MSKSELTLAEVQNRDAAARKELTQRYPLLDAAWEALEKEFAKYHLPDAVWHECYSSGGAVVTYLIVDRGSKDVRIDAAEVWEENPEEFCTRWHIKQAPVRLRVRLVEYVPALREAVVKSAEAFVPKVDDAIQTLNSFVAN